jgi:hypothetical protein
VLCSGCALGLLWLCSWLCSKIILLVWVDEVFFVMGFSKRNKQLADVRRASAEKRKADDKRREDKRKEEEDSERKEEEEEIVKKGKCDLFGARDERENTNVPIGIGGVQTKSYVVVSGNGSKAAGDNSVLLQYVCYNFVRDVIIVSVKYVTIVWYQKLCYELKFWHGYKS